MPLSAEQRGQVQQYLQSRRLDQVVTIALCGPEGAGKQALLRKRCFGVMEDDPYCSDAHKTLWQKQERLHGANIVARWTTHLSSQIKVPLVERDGPERRLWRSYEEGMVQKHVEAADGCVLVYDAADPQSIADLRDLYCEALRSASLHRGPTVVVRNKIDLAAGTEGEQALVVADIIKQGRALAEDIGANHIDASAADGTGIDDVWVAIMELVTLQWITVGRKLPVTSTVPNPVSRPSSPCSGQFKNAVPLSLLSESKDKSAVPRTFPRIWEF